MALDSKIKDIVIRAIREDVGKADITSLYAVDPDINITAKIIAKEDMVICGIDIAKEVFKQTDKKITFRAVCNDGDFVRNTGNIAVVKGKAVSILKAERVALNFLMQLSGIASKARKIADLVKGYNVRILDTRKTIPTLRILQKYAVRVGGVYNHRQGLWDEVIIKENHLLSVGAKNKGRIDADYLRKIILNIKKALGKKIEVEVESIKEYKIACECGPDIILLDNFSPKRVYRAVKYRDKYFPRIKLEASGRISYKNIKRYAETGVDFASIGNLTHSPQAKDISLEMLK